MDIQSITAILTTISLVFIAWYSFEAYQARKNTLMPVLVVYLRQKERGLWQLKLKNIGNGPACNIKIVPVNYKTGLIRFIFDENYLIPGDEEEIRFQLRNKKDYPLGKEDDNIHSCPLFKSNFEFVISCRDIERKVYTSELTHLMDHKIILKRLHHLPPFIKKDKNYEVIYERVDDKQIKDKARL